MATTSNFSVRSLPNAARIIEVTTPPVWPFPTYKGQPYKPPRQPKQDPFKKYPPAPF
jgi:hypothetical protein